MTAVDAKQLEKINITKLSGASLKKQIENMLANSSQCRAILECINHDTGEYRIVLQGILARE